MQLVRRMADLGMPAAHSETFRISPIPTRWRAAFGIMLVASIWAQPAAAGLDAWTSNGPFVTGSAGSARRVAVDPQDPATLYAGASTSFDCGSSVFRSTNGGTSWQTVLDEIDCVSAIVVDPNDPRIIHVAVESGFYDSTDGGNSWKGQDLPGGPGPDAVTSLVLDPMQPGTLYAGTSGGCLNQYDCRGRLLRSDDSGATWSTLASYETGVNAIVVGADATVYVAGGVDYSQPIPGATPRPGFLARSRDRGATWTDIDPVPGALVAQLVLSAHGATLHAATSEGLFGSADTGDNWRLEAAHLPIEQLSVDPLDARSIYALGNHVNAGLYSTELQHSTDDGQTWATLTNPSVPNGGFAPGGLAVAATQPTTLYVAYSDQLYRSTDAGMTWSASGLGLGSVVVGGLAFDPLDDALFATAGTMFRSTDQAASWRPRGETLEFLNRVAFDPQHAGTVYVTSFEGVRKSVDDALTWRAINRGLPYGQGFGGLPGGVLAVDPAVPDVLYLAATQVFTSRDAGETWTQARIGLPDDVDARTVSATPSAVYAGTVSGLYMSADHGGTWRRLDIEGAGLRFVTDVGVDPQHAERVYVATFEGVGRSVDAGATWTRITAGSLIDGQSCTSIAVSPVDAATLYVGTFAGVYRSRDAGATWELFSLGIANNQIVDLVVDPRDARMLYAATQFTGVYAIRQSDIAPPTLPTVTPSSPAHDESGCTMSGGGSRVWTWTIGWGLLLILRRTRARR